MYSKSWCPFCNSTKQFFEAKGLKYEEINAESSENFQEVENLVSKYNYTTVPMIVIGKTFVGGYTDLMELDREKKLDQLLKDEGVV